MLLRIIDELPWNGYSPKVYAPRLLLIVLDNRQSPSNIKGFVGTFDQIPVFRVFRMDSQLPNQGGNPSPSASTRKLAMQHKTQRQTKGAQSSPQEIEDTAVHTCWECSARFTRLEHLKRHITSLHRSHHEKPHGCEFCGKRFSRR
jgi:uncharacterized Zn-finger protein